MVFQASTAHLDSGLLISQSTISLQGYICQLIDLKLLHLAAAHSGDGLISSFKPKTILPHQLWWLIFPEAWKMILTYNHKESWIVRGMIKYGAISVYSFQLSMEHIIKSTKKQQHPPPENSPYDLASSILYFL